MTMTVVITRDVEDRYRGFLASCMLEVAPGCYVGPGMSKGVRERVWDVVNGWYSALQRGAVVMVWPQKDAEGGVGLRLLGEAPKDIVDFEGVLLVRWSATIS